MAFVPLGGDGGAASGSGASVARPVATSYNEMTSAMITEMSAQLARMGQLAIDVENLKSRNAVLEAELAQVNQASLQAPRGFCPDMFTLTRNEPAVKATRPCFAACLCAMVSTQRTSVTRGHGKHPCSGCNVTGVAFSLQLSAWRRRAGGSSACVIGRAAWQASTHWCPAKEGLPGTCR